jgi:xanthine dehydrogenase FAD-binding subunit
MVQFTAMSSEVIPMSDVNSYAAPHSLEEAAKILRAGNVTILAGGTDLMPQSKTGRFKFHPTLMNIQRIPELHSITQADGVVRFGALTTITELYTSLLVRERFNALWQACDHFASDQIRNAATVGGNICNASPAGDTLMPMLVLDAKVVLASNLNGALQSRSMPLADFFVGPGKTKRAPNEIVTGVEIPLPSAGFVSEFFKFGTRPALDISTIAIGLGAVRNGQTLNQVRVSYGAVAPTPIRGPHTEAALEGKTLDEETLASAAAAALADIHPISDVRASDWYRRELIQNMLRRMLEYVRDH